MSSPRPGPGRHGPCRTVTSDGHGSLVRRLSASGRHTDSASAGGPHGPRAARLFKMNTLLKVGLASCAAALLLLIASTISVSRSRSSVYTVLESFPPPLTAYEDHAKTVGYPFWESGASKQATQAKGTKGTAGNILHAII